MFLVMVVVSSILFWHAVFWDMIAASALIMQSRFRQTLIRSIDYVWYATAIVSAIAAVHGIQRTFLAQLGQEVVEKNRANIDARLERSTRYLPACAVISRDYKELPSDRLAFIHSVQSLCQTYTTARSTLRPEFAVACKDRGFSIFSSEERQFPGRRTLSK